MRTRSSKRPAGSERAEREPWQHQMTSNHYQKAAAKKDMAFRVLNLCPAFPTLPLKQKLTDKAGKSERHTAPKREERSDAREKIKRYTTKAAFSTVRNSHSNSC